jgi:hypothetical protein
MLTPAWLSIGFHLRDFSLPSPYRTKVSQSFASLGAVLHQWHRHDLITQQSHDNGPKLCSAWHSNRSLRDWSKLRGLEVCQPYRNAVCRRANAGMKAEPLENTTGYQEIAMSGVCRLACPRVVLAWLYMPHFDSFLRSC